MKGNRSKKKTKNRSRNFQAHVRRSRRRRVKSHRRGQRGR